MSSSRNSRTATGPAAYHRHSPGGGCHHHPHHHLSSPSYSYYYYTSSPTSSASAFASSTSSSFCSTRSPSFYHHHHHTPRSTSPSRVNLIGSSPPLSAPSVRFAVDPRRQIVGKQHPQHHHHHHHQQHHHPQQRRTCMCSPTTHPGSFRCSLHKNAGAGAGYHNSPSHGLSAPSNRLNARRSAMTNSLVRIGTVEGELVKRALAALIRPSSHQQRRRAAFQPRPSRLSIMSVAGDDDDLS